MADWSVGVVIPVYRDEARAIRATHAVTAQHMDDGLRPSIVIVDDGSGDGSAERMRAALPDVHVLSLSSNVGRSEARNAGARLLSTDVIVFMDADCVPSTTRHLEAHRRALRAGAVASVGAVSGDGNGFWQRYQAAASDRRAVAHARGFAAAGSSQNLGVRRIDFVALGGFDPDFRHYGFEDRDLLARLAERGRVAWAADASVLHLDRIRLQDVVRKMLEAGRFSAALFSDRHPALYEQLGYGRIDAALRPSFRILARIALGFAPWAAKRVEPYLERRWIPYPLRAGTVRLLSAAAFMAGTASRSR